MKRKTIRDEFNISHNGYPQYMEVKHRKDSCGKARHWLANHRVVSHKIEERIKLYDLGIEWKHYEIYISSLDVISTKVVVVKVPS